MGLLPIVLNCPKLPQIVLNCRKLSEKEGNARDVPTSHCLKVSQIV